MFQNISLALWFGFKANIVLISLYQIYDGISFFLLVGCPQSCFS
jgi:hypothetical protein